ncbi:tRNA wybutosine-synthesizing protein 2 homolog isoform X2 [Cygnus atratus]|uniref:tRNA wybutosine-synthesizing protein 2 homolog isoform X2 n=1 Tax=Cygnus atratus TaxID=8868 RepID=UPI0021B786D2|nr:tRNA wybutosine-synthesizing protein 2 homolog isoform X2 [Cygnus atratus]
MAAGDRGGTVLALATEPRFAQRLRRYLEEERLLDARYRLQKVPGGSVALPVLEAKLAEQRLRALRESGPLGLPCRLLRIQSPIPSKAASVRTPAQKLRSELQRMVLGLGESWSEELERDVPRSWQRHGDLVLLSEDSFSAALWTKLGIGYFTLPYLVHAAAAFAHACEWNHHAVEALRRNLALNGVQDRCHIHHGDNRQLRLQDVADRVNLGLIPSSEEGWPVACRVLKKGTGGVLHIHHNVEALPAPPCLQPAVPRNEQRPPEDSSSGERELQSPEEMEGSGKEMPAARVRPEWQRWAEASAAWIRGLLEELHGQPWRTSILHIEAVKSYAPHVHHIVLDLECRPALPA